MRKYIIYLTMLLVIFSWACSKKNDKHMQINENEILKISVLKSGEIYVENKTVTLQELDSLLAANAQKNGVVWYYREAAQGEPPPQAMEAISLVIKHKRPISMSSKPDFSDTIDENGNSKPRKK
jgi:hypothetical protein